MNDAVNKVTFYLIQLQQIYCMVSDVSSEMIQRQLYIDDVIKQGYEQIK